MGFKTASSLSATNQALYLDYSSSDLRLSKSISDDKVENDKKIREYKYFGISVSDKIINDGI